MIKKKTFQVIFAPFILDMLPNILQRLGEVNAEWGSEDVSTKSCIKNGIHKKHLATGDAIF